MRRVVLIVNPYSRGVTRRRVAEVTAALARRAEVVVRQTEYRGHATEMAAEAVGEADAVVVFSGDGTYNEAINGAAGELPFGFLPGGGASVFPRALGLPRDVVAAAVRIGAAIDEERTVSIGLGRVNGRRFCFSAGIGFDAEAVRRIENRGRDRDGRRAGNAIFAATVIGVLLEQRLRQPAQLEVDGYGRAAYLFVANGRPYTYAGPVSITIAGEADFAGGLDFVAPKELRPSLAPRLALRGFRGTLVGHPLALSGHDLETLVVRCDRPLPLQADGEDLGDVTDARFEADRSALDVLL
ncbi:MAG TPA: diacylglycerol kinase family protein [Gaiellaceae bacterium]|jgi:diacylglycerol kinase family enzyme|nr:diacylglycerol kinase family protein [Gaiellaceae bacterium]